MEQSKPNTISLFLMVASMVLLAAFQAFWLRKEYNEQKSILQKETDILFKNTIQALEDSVIQKKITLPMRKALTSDLQASTQKVASENRNFSFKYTRDTTFSEPPAVNLKQEGTKRGAHSQAFDMLYIQTAARIARLDTTLPPQNKMQEVLRKINPDDIRSVDRNSIGNLDITKLTVLDTTPQGKSEILIVKSHSPSDTLQRLFGKVARVVMLKRSDSISPFSVNPKNFDNLKVSLSIRPPQKDKSLPTNTDEFKHSEQHFTFRLDRDSLKIKDIERVYTQQIQQSKISLPFRVIRQRITEAPKSEDSKILSTSTVTTTMPIGSTYAAVFPDFQGYLVKKIIPQGLFAFFLLAITGLAFGVIYRNLQQQRRLTELKNDFISNVTHELKTPIATVSVAIEALQNFGAVQNPKLTEEYLEISKNELNRLTLLVDKVLKMTTFEQQGLNLNLESVNVAELVQQVLSSLKLQFEKYKAEVSFDKIGQGFVISADKIHLTNVVYNLLDNALKYSENKPEIKLELQGNDSEIKLSISDKGIGIPPEYQDKIFEKFFRVPTGNMHNVKGYGLGLNYVASVIKQHGGKIEVQSELNKGSMFIVTMPKI